MYPAMLYDSLIFALVFAGVVFVPGLAALILALATSRHAASQGGTRLNAIDRLLCVVHGASGRASVVLLAVTCGLAGAGHLSVCLNVAVFAIAMIWDSLYPPEPGTPSPDISLRPCWSGRPDP
jgi:hypothetical protein